MGTTPPGLPPPLRAVLDVLSPPSLRGRRDPKVRILVAAFVVTWSIGLGFPGLRIAGGAPVLELVALVLVGLVGLVGHVLLWVVPSRMHAIASFYFVISAILLPAHVAFGDGTGSFAMPAVAAIPVCTLYVVGYEAGFQVVLAVSVAAFALALAGVLGFELPPVQAHQETMVLAALATLCTTWLTFFVSWAYEQGLRRTIAALEVSERRALLAIRAAGGGVVEWRANGALCFVSEQMALLVGLPATVTELPGSALLAALAPADASRLRERLSTAFVSLEGFRVETAVRGGAERWLAWEAVVETAAGEPPHVVGIVRDITEERRVAGMKDDFVATVSHELRTPLTTIHGALALLDAGVGGELSPPALELFTLARRGTSRLMALVNDLLDVQRLDHGRLPLQIGPTAPAGVARLVHDMLTPFAASREVGLRVVVASGVPELIESDPVRVEQILNNLVSNACKFTQAGTTVELRVAPLGTGVRFEVEDFGPGIPDAFRPHLFERFSQAMGGPRRPHGGTGLGLNIARTLTERLGGRIGVDSVPGEGATFWVELPARAPGAG